ncbi:unnamed protein product, partial [Medioppia subpectinata]
MSPSGNGPTITANESSHSFHVFGDNGSTLENSIEFLNKSRQSVRKDKVCVVSVIGKSCLSAHNSKASLIDQSIGKNVFRGLFCQMKTIFEET